MVLSPAHSDMGERESGSNVYHIVWHCEHQTETFRAAKPEISVLALMHSVICKCSAYVNCLGWLIYTLSS